MTSRTGWNHRGPSPSVSGPRFNNRRPSAAITKQLYLAELKRIPSNSPFRDDLGPDIKETCDAGDDLSPPSAAFIKRLTIRRRMTSTCFQTNDFNNLQLVGSNHYNLNDEERRFLDAVERGDRHAVKSLLQPDPEKRVNVNCRDIIGRTALEIAVDNENAEIVKILMAEADIRIGNALLHAVHENSYKIVEMLIHHDQITPQVLGCDWAAYRGDGDTFYNYPNYISPIVLAAQRNAFEILQLFLARGAMIDKPHLVTCTCHACEEERHLDSLRFSLKRINIYSALASPAWICLTSQDPVLTAFKLSHKLEVLADVENEFREAYVKMSEQCKVFVCDLLDECRSTDEVAAILYLDNGRPSLNRLKLAIKYKQKQFVTHPHAQQVLANLWYGEISSWRQLRSTFKLLLCFLLILTFPLAALAYLMAPKSKLGRIIRSPFMKFLFHSTSFGVFLVLLVMAGSDSMYEEGRADTRGPAPSPFEWLVLLYVLGFIWNECKQVYSGGLKTYVKEWWNWLDFTMIALYLSAICLRSVAYFHVNSYAEFYGPAKATRALWPKNDPTLVAEALFAMANVFSFARIVFLFQANPHLGPLQISLGCMIIDISKFLLIFFLILTSFACGLTQLYWFYAASSMGQIERHFGNKIVSDAAETARTYTTLLRSYLNLFWSLFGHTNVLTLAVPGDHLIVETVGELLLLAYHAMAIIVLLNMLIAMMSNSFQNITANADLEWKFARTKLWMSYFDSGTTLPAPFNIIISPKSIYYLLVKVWSLTFGRCCCPNKRKIPKIYVKPPSPDEHLEFTVSETESTFQLSEKLPKNPSRREILKKLIARYMAVIKKRLRAKDVNADDLLEIKQDISSLRFELKELARRETLVHNNSIRLLKHDLIQAFCGRRSSISSLSMKRRNSRVLAKTDVPISKNDEEFDSESSKLDKGLSSSLDHGLTPSRDESRAKSDQTKLTIPKIVKNRRPSLADLKPNALNSVSKSSQETTTTGIGGTVSFEDSPKSPRSPLETNFPDTACHTVLNEQILTAIKHNVSEVIRRELKDCFNERLKSPDDDKATGALDFLKSPTPSPGGSIGSIATPLHQQMSGSGLHYKSRGHYLKGPANVGDNLLNRRLSRSRRLKESTKEDETIYQV